MARWTPDPSFYSSPGEATAAAPETLAYVATLNTGTNGDRAPDAITVLDLEEGSPTYGTLVGRLDMPNVGDELHHFGWNACSSALCPWAAHPHVERRYLLVPGLRSSRIHVIDVKEDPRTPKLVKVIEAEEIARKAGYSRPHTDPLRPRRHLRLRARQPGGRRARRHLPARPRGLLGQGPVGGRPRAAGARLRLLVAPQPRHGHHLGVGDAEHGRGRPRRRAAARQQVRPQAPRLGPRLRASTCRRSTSARSTRWCSSCARRTTRTRATGSSASSRRPPTSRRRSGSGRAPRTARCRREKVITIPAEPAEAEQLPPLLQPFGAVPPLDHRHRAVGRRPLALRLLLGDRRAQALRRQQPARAARDRLGAARRDRRPRAAPGGRRRSTAGRRWSRSRATAAASSSPTRSTPPGTSSSTPRGSTAGSSSSTRARTARSRSTPTSSSSISGERPHQVRLQGGDASSDSYCFPDR